MGYVFSLLKHRRLHVTELPSVPVYSELSHPRHRLGVYNVVILGMIESKGHGGNEFLNYKNLKKHWALLSSECLCTGIV